MLSLESGRLAGGVSDAAPGQAGLASNRRGVARDGTAVSNLVGAAEAICQPPMGVTVPEIGTDAGGGVVMAAKRGTKVAMVGSQHKESGEGNQGSATMQRWYVHAFNFASL